MVIENLNYDDCLQRYDRNQTLFYLDPPYYGTERTYGRSLFDRSDFQRLADQLAGLDGAFILSINDVPEIRTIFGRFRFEETEVVYTAARNGPKAARELIIRNW